MSGSGTKRTWRWRGAHPLALLRARRKRPSRRRPPV